MGAPGEFVETSLGELRVTRARSEDARDVLRLRDELARWMVERGIDQWRPGELPSKWIETFVAEGWVYLLRFEKTLAASVTVVWEDPLVWGASQDPAGYIHMLMVDRVGMTAWVSDRSIAARLGRGSHPPFRTRPRSTRLREEQPAPTRLLRARRLRPRGVQGLPRHRLGT